MKWKIRQEKEGDEAAIRQVVERAFEGKSFADPNDVTIVDRLRDGGSLVLSLVATVKGEVIGQIAVSPAKIGAGRYLCVGPIAVLPEHQGKGVGSDLMGHALGVAQAYGRDGVMLMGDPNYYSRFGFEHFDGVTYHGGGADYIQVLPFTDPPQGAVTFHPALDVPKS
ncbi:MAG: N-acetyltransferase [Pseudomonadota bacterium]